MQIGKWNLPCQSGAPFMPLQGTVPPKVNSILTSNTTDLPVYEFIVFYIPEIELFRFCFLWLCIITFFFFCEICLTQNIATCNVFACGKIKINIFIVVEHSIL